MDAITNLDPKRHYHPGIAPRFRLFLLRLFPEWLVDEVATSSAQIPSIREWIELTCTSCLTWMLMDHLETSNRSNWNKSDRVQTSDAFWRSASVLVSELSFKWLSLMFLILLCSNSAHISEIQLLCDGPMDRQTDQQTDGPTDGRTDRRTEGIHTLL